MGDSSVLCCIKMWPNEDRNIYDTSSQSKSSHFPDPMTTRDCARRVFEFLRGKARSLNGNGLCVTWIPNSSNPQIMRAKKRARTESFDRFAMVECGFLCVPRFVQGLTRFVCVPVSSRGFVCVPVCSHPIHGFVPGIHRGSIIICACSFPEGQALKFHPGVHTPTLDYHLFVPVITETLPHQFISRQSLVRILVHFSITRAGLLLGARVMRRSSPNGQDDVCIRGRRDLALLRTYPDQHCSHQQQLRTSTHPLLFPKHHEPRRTSSRVDRFVSRRRIFQGPWRIPSTHVGRQGCILRQFG